MRSSFALKLMPLAMLFPVTASGQLVINEIMQSNIDCIMDDLNEFPDSWVELYNPTNVSYQLSAFSIGDSEKTSKAYSLPSKIVKPGEYVIIYCDKEGTYFHADFRLDSGKGGAVYLFNNGKVVDKIEGWKKQPAPNIAYGREKDGEDKWGYQAQPTPGTANCGKLCRDILDEPEFSIKGQVMKNPASLELSLPAKSPDGARIVYTVDGLEPDANSAEYTLPIPLDKTTVVRAKVVCDGYLSPRSTTHSYIFFPREITLPIVSMVTDYRYFYDDKKGIYVTGSYTPSKPNYEYDWRRPVNLEYFESPESESVINQLCETRVKGGATRGSQIKSLAVYANKRFGTKRFEYEFFPDQTPGFSEFKSFEMRNSGNDFDYMYMRDAIIQQTMGLHTDIDWQASRPVIFLLNGEYVGMLNIRPRSNEDYVYTYYDGEEDIDMFENWWELKEGTWDNYNAFKDFYSGTNHTYEEFCEWMDTEEFCNLMLMNIFFDNKDFPGNNIVMWRPRAEGGKWRWIAKDTDFGMGLYGTNYDYNTITWINTPGYDNNNSGWANGSEHTRLFRRLMQTPEFFDMFVDRAAIYMGDFLNERGILPLIEKRYNEIAFEYPYHRKNITSWTPGFNEEVAWAKKWVRNRPNYFYTQIARYYRLSTPVPMRVDKGGKSGRKLKINGVILNAPDFDGKFYPGRNLKIESLGENDEAKVTGWKLKVSVGNQTKEETVDGAILDIAMPLCTCLEIESIVEPSASGIDDVLSDSVIDESLPYKVFDMSGRYVGDRLENLTKGVYIIRQGHKSVKRVISF